MAMALTEITDDNFRDIYSNNDVVVLDFWAAWCGPCQQFAPTFERVAEKYPQVVFGKVNTEVATKLTEYFGIRGIPTIIAIREQIEVFRGAGALAEADLMELVDRVQNADMAEIRKKVADEDNE